MGGEQADPGWKRRKGKHLRRMRFLFKEAVVGVNVIQGVCVGVNEMNPCPLRTALSSRPQFRDGQEKRAESGRLGCLCSSFTLYPSKGCPLTQGTL